MSKVWLYQKKKILKFSYELKKFWLFAIHLELLKTERELQFSFGTNHHNLICHLGVHLGWCSLLVQFSFCQMLLLCAAYASTKMRDHISYFDQDMVLSDNDNTLKKKQNTIRKSKSIPFSLHGSRRGTLFHLHLDFMCPPMVASADMMYCSVCTERLVTRK